MKDKKTEFRSLLKYALELNEQFFHFWHSNDVDDLAKDLTIEDAPILEKLIISRIQIANFFEILLRIDPIRAKNILIDRYLGESVSPDRKYGGFEFELSLMLDDYIEILGKKELIELINHPEVKLERLKDPRVINSLIEALDFDDQGECMTWINNNYRKKNL